MPPETEMSDSTKSLEASDRLKLIVGVSPLLSDARLELMAMVGAVVSMTIACDAAEPELPAASVTRN